MMETVKQNQSGNENIKVMSNASVGPSSVAKQNDKSCHQCRQNTIDLTVSCKALKKNKPCTLIFCRKCLLNRYGVKAEDVESLEDMRCPKCLGKCNCSICMRKKGFEPTGKLELCFIQERMVGQSAEKSPVGRDDSPGKKTGNKVHIDSENSIDGTSPIANERVNAPAAKDGKGEKIANGGLETAEEILHVEIPEKSTCLMDSEAAEILLAIQDKMAVLSQDTDIKLPVSFDLALSYVKRDGSNVKPQAIRKIFEPLKKHGVSDSEICLIANVGPESVEEAFFLVPSLKSKMSEIREPLKISLDKLANLKAASASV